MSFSIVFALSERIEETSAEEEEEGEEEWEEEEEGLRPRQGTPHEVSLLIHSRGRPVF